MRKTNRMECQGVNPLLLILFAGFFHTVTAQVRTLDMASNAVDDTFSNCRDKMLQAVTGGLLQQELDARQDFKDMWIPDGTCKKQINGATKYHLTALHAYGNSKLKFQKTFNDMVYSRGTNYTTYKDEFPFKSLHFLLTDALKILNHGKRCYTVYYGTGNKYTVETGKKVRFGRFFKSKTDDSNEIEEAGLKGEGTLFNITSCSVVNVENYTCTSEEIEQLISPDEVFTVQSAELTSKDDLDFKLITLTHSHFLSHHDCYYFSRSPAESSNLPVLVLALMVSYLSFYYGSVTHDSV
ncbi:T-cell ecto-ADP-ribosyltransferase 2-like [Hoplias malabaricus]|uniref:T-cell ecto-ADP-ribosyltransferase 2-like n=1 Tax=Hoplias malabaricus TaxID=27720 RepID=UPI0034632BD5